MKCSSFFLTLLLSLPASTFIQAQETNAGNYDYNEIMQGTLQQLQQVLEQVMIELRDVQIELYLKHFEDIEWLEHNYITDTAKGDRLITMLSQEYVKLYDTLMTTLFKKMKLTEEQRLFLQNPLYKDQMLQAFMLGLRENAMVKSTVYKRLKK